MNTENYVNYDNLLRIGDYKKLQDELKDINGTFSFPKQPDNDQIIKLYYLYTAKLELGKFSEVEKFLYSKSFQKYLLNGDQVAKLFLDLLHVHYCSEKEIYSEFKPSNEELTLLESKNKKNSFIIEKIALIYLYQAYLAYKKAVFELYEKYADKSAYYQEKMDNSYYSTIYYFVLSKINVLKGDTNLALSNAQQSYDYSILTKNIKLQAYALIRLAHIYYPRGQIQKALDNCENSFMIGRKLGNILLMGMALFTNAKISHQTADLEQATQLSSKALDYFKKIEYKYGIMEVHNLDGNINHLKGELDESLKSFELSFKESKENEDLFTESILLNNIGNIYSDKGLFDKAIDNYNRSYELSALINYRWINSIALGNLGYNYHLKADYPKAIEYYKKSLEISEEVGQIIHLADIYFNLITLNLEIKNEDQETFYFTKLQALTQKEENKLVYYYFEISHALVLKHKKGMNNLVEAQEILKRLISEDIPQAALKQIAIINLADLMVEELVIDQSEEMFTELSDLIDKLYTLGKEQMIFHMIIESLILKSKIALIKGNLKQAERLLVQASILAEEKNLTYLVNKTNAEYKEFRGQITHWSDFIENNAPLIEKIKLAEIQNYIDNLEKIAFK